MTVICAINDTKDNCVWLGGNDRCTLDNLAPPGHDDKWFSLDEWCVGICGDGPRAEVLQSIRIKKNDRPRSVFDVTRLLREAFDAFDIGKDDEGVRRFCGSGMIVHRDGRVWDHDGALALSQIPADVFWARGSGMEFAIGAAKALQSKGVAGEALIREVVSIVVETDLDCPGGAHVQRLGRDGGLVAVDVGEKAR